MIFKRVVVLFLQNKKPRRRSGGGVREIFWNESDPGHRAAGQQRAE